MLINNASILPMGIYSCSSPVPFSKVYGSGASELTPHEEIGAWCRHGLVYQPVTVRRWETGL